MPAIDRFHYGVCYYPEHWPASQHARDIRRIAAAGFNFVRLGEGAWWYWEPAEGQYQFDLFDGVIDLCRKAKLKVILGTPTYTAPAWVSHRYPQVLRWNYHRQPLSHGSRRNLNYTSPKYLELSDRICTALAEHYAGEKAIFAWQLDNEFNCHSDTSYAPSDTIAFRSWLKARYRTLNRLNSAWGTKFWSQVYDDWEQIDLPHPTATYHNPSQLLDESRFISDCVVDFAARQAAILRRYNRRWLITHNGLFPNVDGPRLAGKLDFFSHDQYPLFYKDWPAYAAGLVTSRSLSFPFGVMEQQAGPGGQMEYLHRTPRPLEQRLWAFQSVAHGAKLLSYFCWQTCPFGSEQHWHGLVDQDGKDTRRLAEAKTLGKELSKLPRDFFDAPPVRVAAVLRDYDNETNDRRINTYNKSGQWEQFRWQAELSRQQIPCDFVWPGGEWAGYRLIVSPHLQIVDRALVQKLTKFVRGGGTLVLGAQSGTMDRNGHVVRATPPGLLRTLAGVEVEDWTTLRDGESHEAIAADGRSIRLSTFVERLRLRGSTAIAHWRDDDTLLGNAPAISRRKVGKGQVFYIGGYLSADLGAVVEMLSPHSPHFVESASREIEVLVRRNRSRVYLSLLNHSDSEQDARIVGRWSVVLGDSRFSRDGNVRLPAHEILVLARSTWPTARGETKTGAREN